MFSKISHQLAQGPRSSIAQVVRAAVMEAGGLGPAGWPVWLAAATGHDVEMEDRDHCRV